MKIVVVWSMKRKKEILQRRRLHAARLLEQGVAKSEVARRIQVPRQQVPC